MDGRIWYFCKLCDHYSDDGCAVYSPEEQETHVNKGFCCCSEIHGRQVEIKKDYVVINGQSFHKISRDLEHVLSEIKKIEDVKKG